MNIKEYFISAKSPLWTDKLVTKYGIQNSVKTMENSTSYIVIGNDSYHVRTKIGGYIYPEHRTSNRMAKGLYIVETFSVPESDAEEMIRNKVVDKFNFRDNKLSHCTFVAEGSMISEIPHLGLTLKIERKCGKHHVFKNNCGLTLSHYGPEFESPSITVGTDVVEFKSSGIRPSTTFLINTQESRIVVDSAHPMFESLNTNVVKAKALIHSNSVSKTDENNAIKKLKDQLSNGSIEHANEIRIIKSIHTAELSTEQTRHERELLALDREISKYSLNAMELKNEISVCKTKLQMKLENMKLEEMVESNKHNKWKQEHEKETMVQTFIENRESARLKNVSTLDVIEAKRELAVIAKEATTAANRQTMELAYFKAKIGLIQDGVKTSADKVTHAKNLELLEIAGERAEQDREFGVAKFLMGVL